MKQIFLFAALSLSLSGYTQAVTSRISFTKGQKLEMVTESRKNSTMEFMGQSIATDMSSTLTEVFDVEDVTTAGATLEHKVKRMLFSMSSPMGQNQSFDSENPEDRKSEMGQLLEKKLLKNKYTITIDATGKIAAVKADDDNPQGKNSTDDEMAGMMAQQLGMNLTLPKIGTGSPFKVLPDREVKKGDSWTDSSSADGAHRKTVYRLSDVSGEEMTVDFTEETRLETTQQLMGVEASLAITDKATGRIILDRKTGLLRRRTATALTEGTMDAQGMTVPIKAKTTTETMIKPL